MRAVVVINALGEGGTERSTADLLPELRDRGIEPVVVLLRSRGMEGVEHEVREQGFSVHVLPPGRLRRQWVFARLLRAHRPGLVHSSLFEANLVARIGRLPTRTPLLTSLVNSSYAPERLSTPGTPAGKLRIVQAVDVVTGPLTTHFHAVSQAVADDASRHLRISRRRITVVRRGRPDIRTPSALEGRSRVRRELGLGDEAIVIANVGRQEPQKDHLTLIDAVEPVLHDEPATHVVVAGREGTATADVEQRLARSPVRARIHLLGHRSDVASVLAASDLYLFTSRHEGLPGSVIEALAMGLPVIASDIRPVREVLGDRAGELVRPGDAAAFGAAVRRLLADPARRRDMGRGGRARFEQEFVLAGSADRMAELYRTVAAR